MQYPCFRALVVCSVLLWLVQPKCMLCHASCFVLRAVSLTMVSFCCCVASTLPSNAKHVNAKNSNPNTTPTTTASATSPPSHWTDHAICTKTTCRKWSRVRSCAALCSCVTFCSGDTSSNTIQHNTTQHNTTQHNTTQHTPIQHTRCNESTQSRLGARYSSTGIFS